MAPQLYTKQKVNVPLADSMQSKPLFDTYRNVEVY